MADKIEGIVEQAIGYTRPLLEASPDRWSAARQGLRRIHEELVREAPDHPALSRLRSFVAVWERRGLRLTASHPEPSHSPHPRD
jgi:hypothetical protein